MGVAKLHPPTEAGDREMQHRENIVVNLWWRRYFKAVGWLAACIGIAGFVLLIPLSLIMGPLALPIVFVVILVAVWTTRLRGIAYERMTKYVVAGRCPACGGDLSHDAESERYKCGLCRRVFWLSSSGCASEL